MDKVLGVSKSVDSYESGPSLASRICKIERQVSVYRFPRENSRLYCLLQVDSLDLKVDRLCQLANGILERNVRQQTSTPTPTPVPTPTEPTVLNRVRPGNYFHLFRRRQRRRRQERLHSQAMASTISPSSQPQPPTPILTSSTRSSSRTNITQPSVPPPTPARDHSRESLVSLYWLFQDNITSSRTFIV